MDDLTATPPEATPAAPAPATPPIPAPTEPSAYDRLVSRVESLLERLEAAPSYPAEELEHLAESLAAKVHAKIAPLLDVLTSTKIVSDVAKLAPAAAAVVGDVVATAREFRCIADGMPCPMHGTVHER